MALMTETIDDFRAAIESLRNPPGSADQLRLYGPFGECAGDRPAVTPMRGNLGGS